MTVLITVNNVYFNNVITANDYSDLKNVLNAEHQPDILWKNSINKFEERPTFMNKVWRVVFLFTRSLYACFIFYFAPMIYLILNEFHIIVIMTTDHTHELDIPDIVDKLSG